MKINLLFTIVFLSMVIYASVDELHGIVGLTKRDGGLGCLCHNITPTGSVQVWIEGPDSVLINSTTQYKLLITGGPDIAGGFDLASYYGELDSVDALTHVLFGELTHSQPNPSINDTISWNFLYTAPNSVLIDTLYSVGNSVNWDSIPSNLDQWNFGENYIINVIDTPVPVELIDLFATSSSNSVTINWKTITETNNSGFEIQRKTELSDWSKITFIPGFGTSTEIHLYTYNDNNLKNGRYFYRLKQVDQNGSVYYSESLDIDVNVAEEYYLEQNYPNPFNPSTKISFHIAEPGFVSLKIFDVLGNEIKTLVNEQKSAGEHEVDFNSTDLTSGIYLYKIETGNFVATKKMILLK